jgi:hypothetical protein
MEPQVFIIVFFWGGNLSLDSVLNQINSVMDEILQCLVEIRLSITRVKTNPQLFKW